MNLEFLKLIGADKATTGAMVARATTCREIENSCAKLEHAKHLVAHYRTEEALWVAAAKAVVVVEAMRVGVVFKPVIVDGVEGEPFSGSIKIRATWHCSKTMRVFQCDGVDEFEAINALLIAISNQKVAT